MEKRYHIPTSLDVNMMSKTITLFKNQSAPIKASLLFEGLGAFLSVCWFLSLPIIKSGSFMIKMTMVACFAGLFYLIFVPDATGVIKADMVPAAINYFFKPINRKIVVRQNRPANGMMILSDIDYIEDHTGLIHFLDGTVGFAYSVVGNASRLLFDQDQELILERVDRWYRKMGRNYEFIYITDREAQSVTNQINWLKERYAKLDVDDDDLNAIANMNYRFLDRVVGSTFKSVNQYLIIKADNGESLMRAKATLINEVADSALVFNRCEALMKPQIEKLLGKIFQGRESV